MANTSGSGNGAELLNASKIQRNIAMKNYNQDCSVCRFMRSLAFTGLGMGLGIGGAYLLGASKQNMLYAGIVTAAILIFGLFGREKQK
jgi:hypothetical protein